MKDFYDLLGVKIDADESDIEIQYQYKKSHKEIVNSDYDNIRNLIDAKGAYKLLSNKGYRFLYDIKRCIPIEDRAKITFNTQEEINSFLLVMESKIIGLKARSKERLDNYREVKATLDLHLKEKERTEKAFNKVKDKLERSLEKEKERCFEMEKTISDLLFQIDNLKEQLISLSTYSESLSKLNNEKDKTIAEITYKNQRMSSRLKNVRLNTFKVISISTGVLLFIFYLIFINLN